MPEKTWGDIDITDIGVFLCNCTSNKEWENLWCQLETKIPNPEYGTSASAPELVVGPRPVMAYLLTACIYFSTLPHEDFPSFLLTNEIALSALGTPGVPEGWRDIYYSLLGAIGISPTAPDTETEASDCGDAAACYGALEDIYTVAARSPYVARRFPDRSWTIGFILESLRLRNCTLWEMGTQRDISAGIDALKEILDNGEFYRIWNSWRNPAPPPDEDLNEGKAEVNTSEYTPRDNFPFIMDDDDYPDDFYPDASEFAGQIVVNEYEDGTVNVYDIDTGDVKVFANMDEYDKYLKLTPLPDRAWRDIPVKDILSMLEYRVYTAEWLKLWSGTRWVPYGQKYTMPGSRILLNYVLTACLVLSDLASPTEPRPADVVEFADKHIDILVQLRAAPYTHWTQWRACYLSYLSRIVPEPESPIPHKHKVKANDCYSQILEIIEQQQLTLENLSLGTLMDKLSQANLAYRKENRQLDFTWGKKELYRMLDSGRFYQIFYSYHDISKDTRLYDHLEPLDMLHRFDEYYDNWYLYPEDVVADDDYIYASGDIYKYDDDADLYIRLMDRYSFYGFYDEISDIDEISDFDEVDDDDETVFVDEKPSYIGEDGNRYVYDVDINKYTFSWDASLLLAKLERFRLGKRTLQELEQLMELLRHRYDGELARPVRYGLLLQCDSDDYGKEFLTAFSQLLEYNPSLLRAPPEFIQEGNLSVPSHDRSMLRVVSDCKPVPVYDISADNFKRENSVRQIEHWEDFWKSEEDFLTQNPNIIGVAIVSEDTIRSTWKQRDHLFYRLYGHHIFLDDLPTEDVFDTVRQQLSEIGMDMSYEFLQALRSYVNTVYPKADLKHQDFVDDLINRILTEYYSVPKPEVALTVRCVPYFRKPLSFDDIISKLDQMVGMTSVKESFKQLYYESQNMTDSKTPMRLHMAFVGNPGTGKTSVAQMTADLLYAMGLIQKNKLVIARSSDLIAPYIGHTAIRTQAKCKEAYGGVLFIDEAYNLAYSDSDSRGFNKDCVNTLLLEMENNSDKLVVIFAGYPKPIERFLDSNEGLRSRVTRIIQFPDYTEEELLKIFEQICQRENFSVAEDGYQALKACIAFEKSGEDFGNARSVENIFQSIRAQWQQDPNEERIFTQKHIRAVMPEQRHSDIGSMIGLDDVKEQLQKFEHRVKYLHLLSEKGHHTPPMNMHMLFMGNPGTGKTTVAQIIADDLYTIGVLKTNKCICIEARDLISNWSDASKITEETIQRAIGGVLFLDEAYALTEYASRNVGSEVVATLITAMEKYRGEMVMIFAGYPDNMRAFLDVNPGLTSRIGHTFHFKDYSVENLVEMFTAKMQKYGFVIADGVREKVTELMEYFRAVPDFGNGRFVDNVIDQTITCRSMRDESDPDRYNEITAEDVPTIAMLKEGMPNGEWFRDPAEVTQEEKRRTAVHEMGHALLSILLRPEIELTSISISAQADSYGRVSFPVPKGNLTEEQMMAQISVLLGGRGAEIVVFGTHSTGCSADYENAKHCAKNMLEYYAMGSEQLGDDDIKPLLNRANAKAMELLKKHKTNLVTLSEMLLEQQELTDEQMRQYLDEHPVT